LSGESHSITYARRQLHALVELPVGELALRSARPVLIRSLTVKYQGKTTIQAHSVRRNRAPGLISAFQKPSPATTIRTTTRIRFLAFGKCLP